MTITATCRRLEPTQPRGWRWHPPEVADQAQPTLPLLSDPSQSAQPNAQPHAAALPAVPVEVVRRFAQLTVEAIQGRRNPGLLQSYYDPAALRVLVARLPVLRPLGLRLASVRAQSPRAGVAEVALRLSGTRDIAVAMRLTGHDRDWRCVVLVIG